MKLLANTFLLVSIAATVVLISIVGSVISSNWLWFGRSGSILTLCGAALATRRLLRLGIAKFIEDENTIDGGEFENTPTVAEAEQKLDVRAASIGFWFIIFGTLIWGYGDLLGGVAQYLSARQGI